MKKILSLVLALIMVLSFCSLASAEEEVKTGLYVSIDLASSKPATEAKDGTAQANISLYAVAIDANGVITDCSIDMIQAKVNFNAQGEITSDLTVPALSKNELGDGYGMRKASSIGKEWNEQLAALCQYVIGKTVDEVKGIAVGEDGKATDVDLAAGITLSISGDIEGIVAAAEAAEFRGARKGDKLALTSVTGFSKSKSATENKEGQAQAYTFVGVITLSEDGTVTSCYIDAMQPTVKFNAAGEITTDLAGAVQTKNQLGDGYGMRGASGIGKEWNEQAAFFCEYVIGKKVSDIQGIAVNDAGKTDDADIAAGCTVSVAEMIELIEKAAK